LALYMDGAPFLKRDSCTSLWVHNLVTNTRHLVLVLRKRELCKCGCRRWCYFYVAVAVLDWMLSSMAEGIYPPRRHTKEPWADDDPNKLLAGQQLGYLAAILFVKGEWMDMSSTMGLWRRAKNDQPCFKCFCTKGPEADMAKTAGHSPLALSWKAKATADYDQSCKEAEILATVKDPKEMAKLLGLLEYDKRQDGAQGRALPADSPALGLLRKDRVEPS